MARRNISIVHWFPELEKHRCGYCKQSNTNCSYGMRAESLTVEDYQYLIDRGWRRSGKYCYKPVMDITCCPLYTIRCEALNFKLSKSQKKNIKRVNRYLSDPNYEKSNDELYSQQDDIVMDVTHHDKQARNFDLDKIETEQIDLFINQRNECNLLDVEVYEPSKSNSVIHTTMSTSSSLVNHDCKAGLGADPNKPPCKKAKLMRLERKQQKLAAKGITMPMQTNTVQTCKKTLEDFIDDISEISVHRLKVCLVLTGGHNKDWTQIRAQEYQVYRKYQMKVHGDPPERCTEKQFTSFLLESPLQIVLKQMHPKDPTYDESAKLFAKYQMFVHDEPPSECDVIAFKEFLVDTPLKHVDRSGGPPDGYGSFHQQYWLDDKLIAVGVIDILPKCVSSVYFFYDPDYRFLTLGTYGSLRELYFVRQMHNVVPDLKYYYMGFYIHSCPKMRYKAKLHPSYLLCPETYDWFPIEYCIPKLDKEKYCRLHNDIDEVDKDACNSPSDMDQLMILLGYKSFIPYKFLKDKLGDPEEQEDYFRFGKLIGKKCIPRILVVMRTADF